MKHMSVNLDLLWKIASEREKNIFDDESEKLESLCA
jgi:hypothetical protein